LESSSQQQLILFVLALVGFLGSLIIAIQVLPNATGQLLTGMTGLVTGLLLFFLGGGAHVPIGLMLQFVLGSSP
jgi:hypothetical protein